MMISMQLSTGNQDNQLQSGFNEWLSKQVCRKDPIGKFARGVKHDKCWPTNPEDEYIVLRDHIRTFHFSSSYAIRILAFETAWEEYQMERPVLLVPVVTTGVVAATLPSVKEIPQANPIVKQQKPK
jgi:uncharacterized protein YozE (UPF0346 family)